MLVFDIKGAFDNAWLTRIIKKLTNQKCPPGILKLIYNYLSDRFVCFENVTSFKLENSCPQGGIMSPFLWLKNINHLLELNIDINCKVQANADGVCVIIMGSKIASMERRKDWQQMFSKDSLFGLQITNLPLI